MRPTRWRRSTHVVIGVAVLLLVAAVVAVAAVLTTGNSTSDAEAVKPAPPAATAKPGIVPVADSAAKPTPDRLAATLAPLVADPNLGALTGRITDAMTGAQLWAQGADVPMQPASTNKVLTTAAALLALDRDARLTTRVMAGGQPGVVVLKGGGDPTLSAAPAGQDTWYKDAARISDLADQVRHSGTEGHRGPGRHQRLQRADHGAGLGSGRHRRRRHRADGGGDARRRPHPAGQRRLAAVHHARAGRRPRAGRRAEGRPGHGHGAATGFARRPGDRIGAVAAADRAAAANDERVRQRDGRVDRPRGRRRTEPAAEFRRRRAGGARPARQRRRSTPAARGCSTPAGCPSTTG